MKYSVTAQAYIRNSFQKLAKERTEVIDTKTNELFKGVANDPFEIRRQYEHFWNDLDYISKEKVFVTSVTIHGRD